MKELLDKIFRPAAGSFLVAFWFISMALAAGSAFGEEDETAQLYDEKTGTYECMSTVELFLFADRIDGDVMEMDHRTFWVFTEDRKTFFVWELTRTDQGYYWCVTEKNEVPTV